MNVRKGSNCRWFSILSLLSITILISLLIDQTEGRNFIRTSRFVQEEGEQEDPAPPTESTNDPDAELSETEVVVDEIDEDEDQEDEDEGDEGEMSIEEAEQLEKELELLEEFQQMEKVVDAIFDQDMNSYYDDFFGDGKEGEDVGPKPVMHTFYQFIDPEHHHTGTTFNQGTGMSSLESHLALLQAWEISWREAGFETRIMNITHAMKHDGYDGVREFLDGEAFGEYDEMCFLRWFAMAAVGGGWMSDYDVVPLKSLVPNEYFAVPNKLSKDDMEGNNGIPLPNKSTFTVYDNNGRVPSLMSGSAKEWERLAQGLMDLTRKHTDDFYSDMYALGDYDNSHKNAFEKENQVVNRLADVISTEGIIDCEKIWKMEDEHFWAVHFSHWNIHDAVDEGILDGSVTHDDRPFIAREFLLSWDEQCSEDYRDAS